MKKLSVLLIIFSMTCTNCFAARSMGNFEGQGYVGTLPDLTKSFHSTEPAEAKPVYDKTKQFNSENQLKPIPRDNPAFVNIILKQDKTSPYLNDINDFIAILEKIYDSIENQEDVQKFAARVYFFTKNADYFRDKYTGKPESSYISFEKIMELSLHASTVSQLRSEAERYSPYLAYTGAGKIYNANNINEQLEYLKAEIEQTIAVLKDAN